MSSKLTAKLLRPDRGEGQGKNTLAKLWSRVMSRIRLTPSRVEEYNRAYVRNPLNGIPNDSGKRSSAAGNIRKEIERETLTWRGFEKLVRWAQPKTAKVVAVIEWKDGTVIMEEIRIRIDDYNLQEEEDDRPISQYTNDEIVEELRQRGFNYHIPGISEHQD